MPTFGAWFRRRREGDSLSQGEVARRLGVDKSTVQNWESNRSTPRLYELRRIMREFPGWGIRLPEFSIIDKNGVARVIPNRKPLVVSGRSRRSPPNLPAAS
jgi:transcriptional regulator with XRE-family HTH domain